MQHYGKKPIFIQVTTDLPVNEKPIRQYPKADKLYDYTVSLSLRQVEILDSRSKESGKTKNEVLREVVDGFLEGLKKDRNLLKRLTEDDQEKVPVPVRSTFKLTGGQLNRLRVWAIKMKVGRSEILRKLIEHYVQRNGRYLY